MARVLETKLRQNPQYMDQILDRNVAGFPQTRTNLDGPSKTPVDMDVDGQRRTPVDMDIEGRTPRAPGIDGNIESPRKTNISSIADTKSKLPDVKLPDVGNRTDIDLGKVSTDFNASMKNAAGGVGMMAGGAIATFIGSQYALTGGIEPSVEQVAKEFKEINDALAQRLADVDVKNH